jgi:hypothetical protein
MTFVELEVAYKDACGILTAVVNAVGLDATESASLA